MQVLPTQPCSGVENWYHGGCGGEGIWGYSEQLLASAGKTAGKWGMAINPIKRRGQHQVSGPSPHCVAHNVASAYCWQRGARLMNPPQ